MKLSEALSERSDIAKRIDRLYDRLVNNAKVQEGENPAEDPEALIAELNGLTERMTELVTRINLTNAATVSDGETVTALIARRDCMTKKINILRGFLDEASSTVSRGMRSEIKIKSTVNVREYQKLIDELSKELRTLDVRLQGLNFTTELL